MDDYRNRFELMDNASGKKYAANELFSIAAYCPDFKIQLSNKEDFVRVSERIDSAVLEDDKETEPMLLVILNGNAYEIPWDEKLHECIQEYLFKNKINVKSEEQPKLTKDEVWAQLLDETHCHEDAVGNRPCDNGCICDDCRVDTYLHERYEKRCKELGLK